MQTQSIPGHPAELPALRSLSEHAADFTLEGT